MAKIEFIKNHKGMILGLMGGCLLVFLSISNVIDARRKVLTILFSVPFLIWDKVARLTNLNDVSLYFLYSIIIIIYCGFLGELISRFKKGRKVLRYWLIIFVLVALNIYAYQYSIHWEESLLQGISEAFKYFGK